MPHHKVGALFAVDKVLALLVARVGVDGATIPTEDIVIIEGSGVGGGRGMACGCSCF